MINNTLINRLAPFIPWFLFMLLALLWSGSFINIKVVVAFFPPAFASGMRVFISLICLSLLFYSLGKQLTLPFKETVLVWCTGLMTQAIPFSLLFYAERYVIPSVASIINSTVSLWSLLLGAMIFRDTSQLTAPKMAGVLLGILGMVIIFYPSLSLDAAPLGLILLTGMSIAYSVGALMTQHMLFKNPRITFEANLVQQHIVSLIFISFVSLMLEPMPEWHNLFHFQVMGAFLYLGVMATALAWVIYFYLIKKWGAVRTGTVMYIVPLLAILWDLLFLDMMPSNYQLLGTTTILLGVVLIQVKRSGMAINQRQIVHQESP